jgi:predicted RNase H-like HicB family nuclease
MREWVPEDHLIWFLSEVVDSLDLSAIFQTYQKDESRGRAGYHPAMMVKLILYAYSVGKTSSRRIERATHEEVPFRVLAADQHRDHDVLADFCRRHLHYEQPAIIYRKRQDRSSEARLLGRFVERGATAHSNRTASSTAGGGRMKKDLAYYKSLPYEREVLPRDDESGRYFVVRLRDMPEVYGFGPTKQNAIRMMREALPEHVSYCLERGVAIPEPARLPSPVGHVKRVNITLIRRNTAAARLHRPEAATETAIAPETQLFTTDEPLELRAMVAN